jgi:hypothetical protein
METVPQIVSRLNTNFLAMEMKDVIEDLMIGKSMNKTPEEKVIKMNWALMLQWQRTVREILAANPLRRDVIYECRRHPAGGFIMNNSGEPEDVPDHMHSLTSKLQDYMFVPDAYKQLPLWTIEPDGTEFGMSLDDYVNGVWHKTMSLVLMGCAGGGKTTLAASICSKIAELEQGDSPDLYYIHTGSIDALRIAKTIQKKGVPLLFDEFTPDDKVGSRLPDTDRLTLKQVLSVQEASSLSARNNEVGLFPDQSRIFTTNASSPGEWSKHLADVRGRPAEEIKRILSEHAKAIYRRVLFCSFPDEPVPPDLIHKRHIALNIEAAAKMRRLTTPPSSSSSYRCPAP